MTLQVTTPHETSPKPDNSTTSPRTHTRLKRQVRQSTAMAERRRRLHTKSYEEYRSAIEWDRQHAKLFS
jgi:hypothetical protein